MSIGLLKTGLSILLIHSPLMHGTSPRNLPQQIKNDENLKFKTEMSLKQRYVMELIKKKRA